MMYDPGPMGPDNWVQSGEEVNKSHAVGAWIGERPDQAAIDAIRRIRDGALLSGEVQSHGACLMELKALGVET